MRAGTVPVVSWAERAADRSPTVQRSRSRTIEQAKVIVDAGRRLVNERGGEFKTQELAKEAGVALQTFYRHFSSKDELLLAVMEEVIVESCEAYVEGARRLHDPIARMRYYLTTALTSLRNPDNLGARRFTTAEHYRLLQLFPDELALADRAFTELLIPEIEAATAAGQLAPDDIERDAWFVTQLVMTTFHHYSFATTEVPVDELIEKLWRFCITALGGDPEELNGAAKRRSSARSSTKKKGP